jgi:hypothetical protein
MQPAACYRNARGGIRLRKRDILLGAQKCAPVATPTRSKNRINRYGFWAGAAPLFCSSALYVFEAPLSPELSPVAASDFFSVGVA